MAKHADPPPDVDEIPPEIPPDPRDYVPLSRARISLRRLLDNPEFCKTPAAVDVAYALGAIEEDVDGGLAHDARVRESKEEALARAVQIAQVFVDIVPKWLRSFGLFRDKGPFVAEGVVIPPGPTARRCMANPSNLAVWVCCQCLGKAAIGAPVAMITDSDTCPVCQHTRCDIEPLAA